MKSRKADNFVMAAIIAICALCCALPVLLVFMVSITDEAAITKNGYNLIPEKLSLYSYSMIFSRDSLIINSYLITILVTCIGTLAAVTITAMAAYTLVNKRIRCRNGLALFFFVTMVFNAGMVPWYMVCTAAGLKDNLFALIVPSLLFSPFNMFLVRNFMSGIPDSLMESARVDGANDAYIAFNIYFPLSKPVLATITLFYGIGYWNDWWNAIMLVNNQKLYTLQFLLYKMKSELSMLQQMQSSAALALDINIPTESFKMATCIITLGPIIALYPYLQKYFVKGMIIGSVKG